jgi:short-subunit dehydrogenase
MEAVPNGVNVSLICPGVVLTPMIHGGGVHGEIRADLPFERIRTLPWPLRPISPKNFAEQALNAVARREALVVLPRWMIALWWLERFSPGLVDWAGKAAYGRLGKRLLK